MFVPRALQHPGWLERYEFCLVGLSDSVPKLDEARWWTRSRILLCFSIFLTSTGAASFVSSSGLLPRPRDCHPHELWTFVVSALVRRRNRCLRVLTYCSSFFVAGKRHYPIPYLYPVVSSSCFSYDRHRPHQNGVFVCLWNDARIQTLHRPR